MTPKTRAIAGYIVRELAIRLLQTAFALVLAGIILMNNARAESGTVDVTDVGFAQAMSDYEDNRWQQAFDQFASMADQGNGQAARMAWLMWRHGPELFDRGFFATAMQRQRWLDTWHCSEGIERLACASLAASR